MQMDLNDLNKVWEVKPLKMTGENEARKILENVAKQVHPIMHKRKWKVHVLLEFCPSNPSLMGLNIDGGAEIKLRLRRPERQWDFFPYEQILDTMLHELCHNEHGPHNADFYKLLDELRQECEELMVQGIKGTGRGFDLSGRRLGGSSPPPPLPFLRQNALTAAERRAQLGTLLPSGPRNIGGDSSIKAALSPIQAAAMAAERRLRDELWCGSQSLGTQRQEINNDASSSRESQKPILHEQSQPHHGNIGSLYTWKCSMCTLINKPLALACEACQTPRTKEDGPSVRSWSCKFCTLMNNTEFERCSACGEGRYSYGPSANKEDESSVRSWSCKFCTLMNDTEFERCSACGEERDSNGPPSRKEGGPSVGSWSCKFCTLINNSEFEKCSACGEWRYSYGPPASGYTPHVGT